MNFLEILKQNGLNDETITKIGADMKANKVFTASEENLDVRYQKLKMESDANNQELVKSQALITELQKGTKGNEELTNKIKNYETEIATLKSENEKTKLENALDRALLEANVKDIDYVKFKLKEKGTEFKLDENGKLEKIQDSLDALKVQLPDQFKNEGKKVEELKLPKEPNDPNTITKEQFKKMSYAERASLFENNKETFEELTKEN